jgi:hypothetical protein
MNNISKRAAAVIGLLCLMAGIVIGRAGPWPGHGFGRFGVPEIIILLVPVAFVAFWVLLIGGILRGMGWIGAGRPYRLDDLPADFDEWHRRAHAHMKETDPADDSARRG